jgi:hypothetical protein
VLTNCGGKNSKNSSNANDVNITETPVKKTAGIIKPSQLIDLKDVIKLMGADFKIRGEIDKPESLGGMRTVYNEDTESYTSYMFQIAIKQDAALEPNSGGSVSSIIKSLKAYYEKDPTATKIEGVGDWAYFTTEGVKSIIIAYGNYDIDIALSGKGSKPTRNDAEEIEWKKEKLTQAGKLAVERLKTAIEYMETH